MRWLFDWLHFEPTMDRLEPDPIPDWAYDLPRMLKVPLQIMCSGALLLLGVLVCWWAWYYERAHIFPGEVCFWGAVFTLITLAGLFAPLWEWNKSILPEKQKRRK